ncbi:unnamed protein product [Strongylus vulgaris]|uniref:Uncharacterized protein n=1 Tax=Strongylus vulgaris TaxID=40348 RepID=A0A3P7J9M0_STRVU|nr:unnamed protein product [Strongylus vulgaris]
MPSAEQRSESISSYDVNVTFKVSGKFLKEAASMLDTANDSSKERIQQSAWLLSQQPFLNLVLACLKGEDFQPNKDLLVSSLYKQLLDLTSKTKEVGSVYPLFLIFLSLFFFSQNPALPLMEKFAAEREGLLLRLSLVGGIFKQFHPIIQVTSSGLFRFVSLNIVKAGRTCSFK